MDGWMNRWTDGQTKGQTDRHGWTGRRKDLPTDRRIVGHRDRGTDGQTRMDGRTRKNERTGGWMDVNKQTDKRMDGWTN